MQSSQNGGPVSANGHRPNGVQPNGVHGPADGRTVIMGAGPGGLCSAYVLSKAGRPAVVLEKAPFVGGLARTIQRA